MDRPKYVLPLDYKAIGLTYLLKDAVKQLEKNHGVSFATTAPAGLFGHQKPGFLWRPSLYLDSIAIKTTKESYGPVTNSNQHYSITADGKLQVLRILENEPSTPRRICDYQEIFHGAATSEVFDFIVLAAQH